MPESKQGRGLGEAWTSTLTGLTSCQSCFRLHESSETKFQVPSIPLKTLVFQYAMLLYDFNVISHCFNLKSRSFKTPNNSNTASSFLNLSTHFKLSRYFQDIIILNYFIIQELIVLARLEVDLYFDSFWLIYIYYTVIVIYHRLITILKYYFWLSVSLFPLNVRNLQHSVGIVSRFMCLKITGHNNEIIAQNID